MDEIPIDPGATATERRRIWVLKLAEMNAQRMGIDAERNYWAGQAGAPAAAKAALCQGMLDALDARIADVRTRV